MFGAIVIYGYISTIHTQDGCDYEHYVDYNTVIFMDKNDNILFLKFS